MINKNDKNIIYKCAKKYGVEKVILFGSSLTSKNPNDIDLGVLGIAPEKFFAFYAEIFRQCSIPIDVVDLSGKSLFNDLILKEGKIIYG